MVYIIKYYVTRGEMTRSGRQERVTRGSQHWARVRDAFVEAQAGRCAICERTIADKAQLDHCHATGFIRGALCSSCNVKLGWYEKRRQAIESYLARAAEWIAHEPARPAQGKKGASDEKGTHVPPPAGFSRLVVEGLPVGGDWWVRRRFLEGGGPGGGQGFWLKRIEWTGVLEEWHVRVAGLLKQGAP